MMFVTDDPMTLRHLERALVGYLDRLRRDGYAAPPDLLALLRTVAARSGQERPKLAPSSPSGDGDAMSLTVTYQEAGRMLSCSERTVRRLVATGAMPVVEIAGRTRRIAVSDIKKRLAEGFVESRSSVASARHCEVRPEECASQQQPGGRTELVMAPTGPRAPSNTCTKECSA